MSKKYKAAVFLGGVGVAVGIARLADDTVVTLGVLAGSALIYGAGGNDISKKGQAILYIVGISILLATSAYWWYEL